MASSMSPAHSSLKIVLQSNGTKALFVVLVLDCIRPVVVVLLSKAVSLSWPKTKQEAVSTMHSA